jgi:hypothetical protein
MTIAVLITLNGINFNLTEFTKVLGFLGIVPEYYNFGV